jgi:peptidoglycan LD-endopeptidase CwlK
MAPDAWAIHFGNAGIYRTCVFDRGRATEIAAQLHGTVHPMVYEEHPMPLDQRSERNLAGVHPQLVGVVRLAHDQLAAEENGLLFVVTEGLRTRERQAELVRAGASRTMNSKHLPQADGMSHAVDVAATVTGAVRWDFPLYDRIAFVMKKAATSLGVQIEWGGDWQSFRDGPHYQLAEQIHSA